MRSALRKVVSQLRLVIFPTFRNNVSIPIWMSGVRIPTRERQFLKFSDLLWCSASLLFKPLNPELNPICHLLAFLGAHHILHISRIRVNYYRVCSHRVR
jgi:hypothetical protein